VREHGGRKAIRYMIESGEYYLIQERRAKRKKKKPAWYIRTGCIKLLRPTDAQIIYAHNILYSHKKDTV
jgi:hypothetical protein